LAFATGNHLPVEERDSLNNLVMVPNGHMNNLFEATAEAVEEAILNALTAAETTIGLQGHTAYALPLDELQAVMQRYARRG
jgi:D-aminopeptidase